MRGGAFGLRLLLAGVAQLVEHLICNQRVGGSNPFASSSLRRFAGVVSLAEDERESAVEILREAKELRIAFRIWATSGLQGGGQLFHQHTIREFSR